MAKSNLLKTQDVTFLDLIGNGKKYRVPSFQRDYAWEEEQWEDLWNDIQELLNAPRSFHYMGALVVEAVSDREFQIIDGQQRVATLSVLALAVIDRLQQLPGDDTTKAANAERAPERQIRYSGCAASACNACWLSQCAATAGCWCNFISSTPRGKFSARSI